MVEGVNVTVIWGVNVVGYFSKCNAMLELGYAMCALMFHTKEAQGLRRPLWYLVMAST
jgi:hypothetical protein